jgi:hypothetical protein
MHGDRAFPRIHWYLQKRQRICEAVLVEQQRTPPIGYWHHGVLVVTDKHHEGHEDIDVETYSD